MTAAMAMAVQAASLLFPMDGSSAIDFTQTLGGLRLLIGPALVAFTRDRKPANLPACDLSQHHHARLCRICARTHVGYGQIR